MRTPKRRHAQSTPLTKLRKQLGSENKLLSINRLGAIADIPPATLRSVEIGRRSFNPDLQKRMRRRGLEWQPKTRKWFFTYDHKAVLSLPLLELFRRLGRGDEFFQGLDLEAAKRRLTALLQQVDERAYHGLLLDLNDALETLRETYTVSKALKEFQETELHFEFIKTRSGGQTLVKKFSGLLPPDHLFGEEEHGESSSAVQPAA
jgi:hypothetical protein